VRKYISNSFTYYFMLVLIVLEVGIGAIMAYFSIPAFLQPIHLLVGVALVGVQYWFFLLSGCRFAVSLEK